MAPDTRHYKMQHAGVAQAEEDRQVCNSDLEEPNCVSKCIEYCAVDLTACEVPWLLEKLDQLADLRTQPMETHDQCIAWQNFKDERAAGLPSLEKALISLDAASCSDAWRSNNPVRLTDHDFLEWKVHLLERKNSKIRLLDVPIAEDVASQEVQDHYHAMVRDKVQIERMLACYKQGPWDLDVRVRGIHIDCMLCTMSAEQVIMRRVGNESYITRLIETLKGGRMFGGSCGLCNYFDFTPRHDIDCWEIHPTGSEQHIAATDRGKSQLRKKSLSILDPTAKT
jgi:hypothetical protein